MDRDRGIADFAAVVATLAAPRMDRGTASM
jgi:hypothetical protein